MVTRSSPLLTLVFLFASSLATVSHSDNVDCIYSMYVKTAADWGAGTDSNVSITFYDRNTGSVTFDNLVTWGGVMGPNHIYFQQGSVDIFTGKAKCLDGAPCQMNLTLDGTPDSHSWKCKDVKVAMFRVDTGGYISNFYVDRWLERPNVSTVIGFCRERMAGENTFGPHKAFSQIMSQIL